MRRNIENRNRAFAATCRQIRDTYAAMGFPHAVERIIEIALDCRAPAYFVDQTYAARIIKHYEKTGSLPRNIIAQGRKWVDFTKDYLALCRRFPQRSRKYLINMLCTGAAGSPRFYLNPRQALAAYHC